jgi:hypothetical protein
MGLENEEDTMTAPPSKPREPAQWPPIAPDELSKPPSKAINTPLPLRLTEAPIPHIEAAAAAKAQNPYYQTALDWTVNRLTGIQLM